MGLSPTDQNNVQGGDNQDDDEYLVDDDSPAFINPEDVVEVEVNDDDVPMDDDDEDEDDDDDDGNSNEAQQEGEAMQTDETAVVDMSRLNLRSHTGPVFAVASHCSEGENKLLILSGGGDDKAYLHHVDSSATATPTNNSILLEHAHTDSVSAVALNLSYVSEDLTKTPRLAAVGGYDGAIVIYDPDTGRKLQVLEGPTDVEWLAFHPVGGTVLLAGSAADGTVWMYHIPLQKCLQVFVGHETAVNDGTFSVDGKWAITCSSDGTLRIWAPKTGQCKHVFRFSEADDGAALTNIAIGGGTDENLIMVGSENGLAHVCHVGTKKVVVSLRHYEIPTAAVDAEESETEFPSTVEAVGFSKMNPNWCATGGVDGVLKVWDLANHAQCRHACRVEDTNQNNNESNINQGSGITRLYWHPTLPVVICSYTDGAIRMWDARNGQLLYTCTGSAEVLNDMTVQFINDGKTAIVVSGSDDGSVRVFDINVATILETVAK